MGRWGGAARGRRCRFPRIPACPDLTVGRMQSGEMVDAILDGQGDGLAAAYDRYASALYGYCRSLLGEPSGAAGAVQDTFIIAVGALGGAGEPADDAVGLGAGAESAELRTVVSAALAGLDPGDREIVELNLRHDLDGQELADVLGVSVSQARVLVSRAWARFEASLRALLTARTGQDSCPQLAAVMSGWDGRLDALLRKRINRHAERCENCRERGRYELDPAMLLGMLPAAVPPAGLRGQLFDLASDVSPVPSAYRAGVIRRAGPFRRSGFPVPLDPPHARRPVTWALAAGAGAAVLAVIAGGILLASGTLKPSAPHSPGAAIAGTPSGPARAGTIPTAPTGPTTPVRAPLGPGAAATGTAAAIPSVSPVSRASSPPPASASPGPSTGILAVSPAVVTLHLNSAGLTYVGSFTLTAQGGPISSFRISNPDPLDLAIRPSKGSLTPGQTVNVRLTVLAPLRVFTSNLALKPGSQTVIVRYPPAR